MEKPIIAIDFSGALLTENAFDNAHVTWFKIFSDLLNDESIKEYAFTPNYFEKVTEIMTKYLGDVGGRTKNHFARELFSMIAVANTKESDVFSAFVTYLREIKGKYRLALITSSPASSVDPILQKVGCADLFDLVYKSPAEKHPSKEELFKEFIEKEGKPELYIGCGDKDLGKIKDLGIKTIAVTWVKKGEVEVDHVVNEVNELKEIL